MTQAGTTSEDAIQTERDGHRSPLFRWIFPALGVVSLLGSCILWSSRKQLWADETFTHTELSDPSFRHLLHAVPHLGGGGMPLFYLTAWPWAHLFGLSDLSLRLYSSAGVCAAFVVLLLALRRIFSAQAAFLGVAFGIFACFIVVDENAEARAYGLYLLLAALAVAQALYVARTPRPNPLDLALVMLSQAGLVLGHVLGIFYGGLMLLALAAADRWNGRMRWKVYVFTVVGWLALVPWIPAIQASMAVGKPHSWIPMPKVSDLVVGFSYWLFAGIYYPVMRNLSIGLVAGWLCAMAVVVILVCGSFSSLRSADAARRPVFLMGLALMAGPVLFFVVSHVLSPVYVPRYMVPSALGVALLAAGWAEGRGPVSEKKAATVAILILLLPLGTATLAKPVNLDVARIDSVAAGRPVVCDWLRDFMALERYSAQPALVQYPLDWDAALAGPLPATGDVRFLENYRREGYLTQNIRDVKDVLSQKSFLVLDDADTNWFELEIAHNPRFAWKVVVQIDKDRRLVEVATRDQVAGNR